LAHAGLALATSLSSYINSGLLLFLLLKKGLFQPLKGWGKYLFRVAIANIAMSAFLFWFCQPTSVWLQHNWRWQVPQLCYLIAVSVAIYFVVLFVLGVRLNQFRMRPE